MADISKIKLNNTEYNIKDSTARGVADTAIQSVKVNGTALTPDGSQAVDITAIPASIVSAGALVNGMTATTQSTSDDSTKLATTAFVHDVVDELPEPMIFKSGMTLTADSTDTTKCAITVTDPASASDIKVGYTYKVTNISGTYTGTIKVGDTLIAKKNAPKVDKTWVVDTDWTVVPSGDETGYVVGKSSGTTQNNLVKWGADGYTIDDSGIAVETSFSGTSDAKVPTSKSIKTNVADNAVLTGFTPVVTPSAIQDVASTDTITDAMEKLDNNTRLNKNNISINSIKSSITMEQGYTLVTQSTLYKQGKHIFGNLIIKKDSGNFSNTSEIVCTLGNPPAITGMLFCGFGASEWGIESIGYAFLGSNGGVSVKDTKTTNTTVNIAVDYVIS